MDLDSNNVVLSNLYKKYFEKYLLTKVDFVQFDNMLKNSKLDFGDLDFKINLKSHLDEFLNTNHFFILNRFCVKKAK